MRHVLTLMVLFALIACSESSEPPDAASLTGDLSAGDLAEEILVIADNRSADGRIEGEVEIPPDDILSELPPDLEPEDPWEPPFDPTVCGSPAHEWLPPDGMGAVVLSQEEFFSHVTTGTIDGILEETGYGKFGKAKYGARNFKIRYVTQDRGQLTEATAVVGIPVGDDVPWPAPILLWLHGTSGFMDDCAPSHDMFLGAGSTSVWAGQGYVTVAPDYMGMLGFGDPSPPGTIHSYLVGEATAISSLDSARAAVDFLAQNPELGSADSDRVVMFGGSQGGHAAFFTELYWPYYAPEFNVLGIAAAVPLVNLLGQAAFDLSELVNGTGNLLIALVAMKNWYGVPADLLGLLTNQEPYFTAQNIEGWLSGSCHLDVNPTDVDEVSDIFLEPVIAAASSGQWDDIPPWGCFLRENSIPGSSVVRISDVPILTSYAEEDELLITAIEQEVWPELCENGYRLEYKECAGLEHSQGGLAILAYARIWLADRVAGIPLDAASTCIMEEPVDCVSLVPDT